LAATVDNKTANHTQHTNCQMPFKRVKENSQKVRKINVSFVRYQ
jgi:hypothetical protein